jgi:hypothetical protein
MERVVVGWNRNRLDLSSDEVLAQLLDRGDLDSWRELFGLARGDHHLRRRLVRVIHQVPLPFPRFWQAALAALGEPVDWSAPLPEDEGPA